MEGVESKCPCASSCLNHNIYHQKIAMGYIEIEAAAKQAKTQTELCKVVINKQVRKDRKKNMNYAIEQLSNAWHVLQALGMAFSLLMVEVGGKCKICNCRLKR